MNSLNLDDVDNFTFEGPESYEYLKEGSPISYEVRGEKIDMSVIRLPVGAVLHRADRTGAKTPSDKVPAFFGNQYSIRVYAGPLGKPAYSSYVVKKEAKLFVVNAQSIMKLFFHPKMTAKEKAFIDKYLNIPSAAVLPSFPLGQVDGHTHYLNREIANIVCKRLGLDGWIVLPFDAERGRGMKQISFVHGIVPYAPEIMLCKWTDVMDTAASKGNSKRKTVKNKNRENS